MFVIILVFQAFQVNYLILFFLAGQKCTVYDVAINNKFFSKVEGSLVFQTFLVTAAMEGLEDKYHMELDKNGWTILKNRKCFGTIGQHRIERREEEPFVQEVPKPSQLNSNAKVQSLIEEISPTDPKLQNLVQPDVGPKFAVAVSKSGFKFILATIPIKRTNPQNLSLHVGDDCLVVKEDTVYICNVKFPYRVNPNQSKNVFNRHNLMLTILLPLA